MSHANGQTGSCALWYKNSLSFDAEHKYWLIQDSFTAVWGWRFTDLPWSQACSMCRLRSVALFTAAPVGNVRHTHTNTRTHSSVLSPAQDFGGVWQQLLSANQSLNFYAHMHTATKQATQLTYTIFKHIILGKTRAASSQGPFRVSGSNGCGENR